MRALVRRLAREEDGVVLVIALAIMFLFAITTSGILAAGTVNQRTSYVSDEQRQAFGIAQEGLAYAEGMLYAAAQSHTNPPSGWQSLQDLPAGTGQYAAVVAGDGVTWTMIGTGTINGISRTVKAQATVPSPVTTTQTGVWNYLYADGTASCTTWNGNVNVAVPVLTRGSVCLSGSQTFSGATLEVGGNLSVTGSAKIGTSTLKIQTIKVGLTPTSTNTCTVGSSTVMPGTGGCNGNSSPIYSTTVAEGVDVTPSMPCIGQPSSYDPACTGANDGTWTTLHTFYNKQATLPKSGCPANLFDNDTTLNNSDTSISTTMFGAAYDCLIGSTSNPCTSSQNVCEIKWTPSTHTLAASGVFYFDGSLTLSGQNVTYSGLSTFYETGGVTANPATFCAASAKSGSTSCTAAWNTLVDGIIMVAGCWANSTGSSLITTSCVGLGGNTTVQFGVYCVTQYSTGGGASNMGPVLANTLSLGGGAQTLIPFHYFPPGTPLNTSTSYLPASSPTNWQG
jgi:Tfp pilus assembly protein PilX